MSIKNKALYLVRAKLQAPTFLSAGKGDFPVASSRSEKAKKHGTRKSREPAGKNACATPDATP